MQLLDISLSSPEENILFDDVLLDLAEQHKIPETIRFWESRQYFIVLGRISKEAEDLNHKSIYEDGVPVLRRSSGGGTVVQGPGCLNYTLVLSKSTNHALSDIRQSYQFILGKMVEAFQKLNLKTSFFPISDLAILEDNKKFSGNAQRRGKEFILHHGTILYDFDLKRIARYLKIPKDIPEYRQGRSHGEFVTNISCNLPSIKSALTETWNAQKPSKHLSQLQKDLLQKYCDTKTVVVKINP